MPHTSSAKKRLRQTEKRRDRNREAKKAIKVQVKKYLGVLKDGTNDQAQAEYNATAKLLDKAGARRVIHPNKAGRKKSQMALKLAAKKNPPKPAAG
jgi:small subunit ribosomal protein S20